MPWPISRCLTITVTVLSAPMRTNALGANAPDAAAPAVLPGPDICAARIVDAEREPGAGRDGFEEAATGHRRARMGRMRMRFIVCLVLAHASDFAASLIAARMRTYVAQRHTLPAMARVDVRVASGAWFLARSAAADMIWPDWQ